MKLLEHTAKILDHTELFRQCYTTKLLDDGTRVISCVLGLWQVEGKDWDRVEREAFHYWQQYYYDGEYDKLLFTETQEKGEK